MAFVTPPPAVFNVALEGPGGAMGPQGIPGERGPAGQDGADGAQGPPGAPGTPGAQGPKGDTGDTGPAGATGATGATGAQGPQGDTGPQGPAGTSGGEDDVIEFANLAAFPVTGAAGLIYVAKDTNKIYRWSEGTGAAVAQVGSAISIGNSTGGNTGVVTSTLTVPAGTELALVSMVGFDATSGFFSTGTVKLTKGGVDTTMTAVPGGGDLVNHVGSAMWYMAAPDIGTNKTLRWQWTAGDTFPDTVDILWSVTFWKNLNSTTPFRGGDGAQSTAGAVAVSTPTLTAAVGDRIVAFAGGYNAAADESATFDTWLNLTELAEVTHHSNFDGAWATTAPSGNTAVGLSTGTNIGYTAIKAAVLVGNAAGPMYIELSPSSASDWGSITGKPSTFPPDPEAVDDRVASLLVAGSNITLTYNDAGNALTVASTASTTGILINGGFRINQGGYVSATALTAGSYGHDQWKAGAAGGDYSFTQLAGPTQITIASGKTLIQPIEDARVAVGGAYVLSWTGTAQARAGVNTLTPSGSYAASPLAIAGQTAGTVMSIEFNTGTLGTVKLESGTIATPFVAQDYANELAACMRYFQKITVTGTAAACSGQAISTNRAFLLVNYPAGHMRSVPTLAATGSWNLWNAGSSSLLVTSGPALLAADTRAATLDTLVSSGLVAGNITMMITQGSSSSLSFSARL